MPESRLEVWGDPIAHSLSPALHAAAYDLLGWDWHYGRRRVDESTFEAELASLAPEYRGLSLTMPLKGAAFRAAAWRDDRAEATGAVNTFQLTSAGPRGYNTDVGGIVRALSEVGVHEIDRARIIGAGATATSALVALAEIGAVEVEIFARRPEAIAALAPVAERLGITVIGSSFDEAPRTTLALTVSTLPGNAPLAAESTAALASRGGVLFDVVYGHWPTSLATAWQDAGQAAVSGAAMLLHQAVLQIRIFATGDVDEPLPQEEAVIDVMRRALVGG